MRFRDDIDLDNTWVVSDTHFGHENIVPFCHRPLDHEQVMIAEWRATVPEDATVLHLGDLCYKGNAFFKHIVAKELTGARKLLIRGNHDKGSRSFYRDCGFQEVKPFKLGISPAFGDLYRVDPIWADSKEPLPPHSEWVVSFSHYSMDKYNWEPNHWRIHGHIHNNGYTRDGFVPFLKNHINLSVEQTKYRPVNLGVLLRAVLLGVFPESTEEQLAEAKERKEQHRE